MRIMSITDWAAGFDPAAQSAFPKRAREPRVEPLASNPISTPAAARRETNDPSGEDLSYNRPYARSSEGAAAARDDIRRALQKAENAELQNVAVVPVARAMSVNEMLQNAVWVADGSQVGFLDNPRQVLAFSDFAGLTAASVTAVDVGNGSGKIRDHANSTLWKQSRDRYTVDTRTFHAGAPAICQDPDGNRSLNSWRTIPRRVATQGIQPFLGHVAYLFEDETEREAFLDWLSHLEQRPGVLPHYGWLHVAKSTGTGRNWLASLLARLWRGYVAPNVDLPELLSSPFNGKLAGRILAIVDEVQEGGGENPYRHTNKLKSLVNAEYREGNPKYGRQYREHNSCRWLVFSNHDNALPLNDADRRWRVVRHEGQPKPPDYYSKLYALLAKDEFINAVGVWLSERDIAQFNPGERPPMNNHKRAVVNASKTPLVQNAEQLVAQWPADVVTNRVIATLLSDSASGDEVTPAMRRALTDAGAVSAGKVFTSLGKKGRGWVLRDHSKWASADAAALAFEAGSVWADDPLEVLHRVQNE